MERRSLLRPFAFVVLVFGAMWCVMILHWRSINRVPNGEDVVLYLVVLPLGLLLGFVLLRRVIDVVKKRRQKAAATEVADADAASPDAPKDPSLEWQLPIFAADALFPAGNTPAALIDAARAGQRAELHPNLRDNRGLPAFAATVDDIDLVAIDDSLPETAQSWSDARKRALALAQMLATRMLDQHFEALQATAASTQESSSDRAASRPVLQLEWLLPAHWSDMDRETAQGWLATQLATEGWSAPSLQMTVTGIGAGAGVLKRLDDLNRAFHADIPTLPHLLLASDSHTDEATVAEWDATHRLHGFSRPEGQVPGEGASALLLAIRHPNGETELARLHRLLAGQRVQPVDKPGRLQADTFRELVGQALEREQLAPDALAYVVGDTDMRTSRSAEAMHLVEQALPERDPVEVLLPLGLANGECGAALALATVAVAAQLAADTQQPGLILSHHDASLRAVVLVTPPSAVTATSTTPTLA
jgi:hypothetical protein